MTICNALEYAYTHERVGEWRNYVFCLQISRELRERMGSPSYALDSFCGQSWDLPIPAVIDYLDKNYEIIKCLL